ncbi:hypothetical protein [Geomicrobium sp. JCM 19055]|uniref:hypothetical protein n=1 Tax=Geomicrobium sp. JCM 19055 TaxID=1460649 RepID=UPI0005A8CEAD|nr:hypothetical protein [Geomicrobium sp. JCM 19055]
MALTLKGSGKIIGNKELLPPFDLTVQDHDVAAIQADIEHMDAFFCPFSNRIKVTLRMKLCMTGTRLLDRRSCLSILQIWENILV